MRILYRKLFSCNYGVWGSKVHTSQMKVKSRPWVDGSVAYVDITGYSNRHMASVNLAYSPVSNLENFLSIPHFFVCIFISHHWSFFLAQGVSFHQLSRSLLFFQKLGSMIDGADLFESASIILLTIQICHHIQFLWPINLLTLSKEKNQF